MKDLSIMVDDVKFNYRVGLLIEKRGKILVEVNPDCDFVVIPGGRVKTLEFSKETVSRELFEEMGILIRKDEFEMKSVIENFFEMDGIKCHELFFLYKLKPTSLDYRFASIKTNKDSVANYYKWIDKNKLDEVKLLPKVLKEVLFEKGFKSVENNDLDNN